MAGVWTFLLWKLVLGDIPDFGVSMIILNTTDISPRWCKLNFGSLTARVKSSHFPEKIDARKQYFYFLYKFFRIIGKNDLDDPFG